MQKIARYKIYHKEECDQYNGCPAIKGKVQRGTGQENAFRIVGIGSINALSLANFLFASRKVSFDVVVETMYQTGKDLSHLYRETSEGGLARLYNK